MKNHSNRAYAVPFVGRPRKTNAELRISGRVDVRPNEGISAEIIEENKSIPVRVFDISTSGACVILPPHVTFSKKVLDPITLQVHFAWEQSVVSNYYICWIKNSGKGTKIGLRLNTKSEEVTGEQDRNKKMVTILESYPVFGYLYKDFCYSERSVFKLLNVSSKYALIDVWESEHVFFTGKKIELLFSLQTTKGDRLNCTIEEIREVRRNSVILLVSIQEMTSTLEQDLINHIILNPNSSLESVRDAGFKINKVANHFRFRFIKTQEEYEQVLELRYRAYAAAKKVAPDADITSMIAPLDHISRILVAFHGDKIIASVSLSFPESEGEILDTERPLENGYPSFVPPKVQMIEVARLCTDPDYRRGDLLLRMFEHIYRVFVTSGRQYLISSTDKKLWPIYKNLGFKKLGIKYAHPYLKGIEHDIILIDLEVPTSGKGIDPLRWAMLYSRMTNFLERRNKIKRSYYSKIKFRMYQYISKIIVLFLEKIKK